MIIFTSRSVCLFYLRVVLHICAYGYYVTLLLSIKGQKKYKKTIKKFIRIMTGKEINIISVALVHVSVHTHTNTLQVHFHIL